MSETSDRYVGQKELLSTMCISRTTLWEMRKSGAFPKPVRSFGRRMIWLRAEVEKWQREHMESDEARQM